MSYRLKDLINVFIRKETIKMEDKIFNSWIAAFWEGEGSLCKIKEHVGYRVMICQSIDPKRSVMPIMNKIQKKFGGHISIRKIKNYKPRAEWVLTRRDDVIHFIKTIYPYCHIRKIDLENCLIYFKTHPRLDKRDVKIDIKKIKNMLNDGKTYVQIAEIIGILTPSAIWKRLHKEHVLTLEEA